MMNCPQFSVRFLALFMLPSICFLSLLQSYLFLFVLSKGNVCLLYLVRASFPYNPKRANKLKGPVCQQHGVLNLQDFPFRTMFPLRNCHETMKVFHYNHIKKVIRLILVQVLDLLLKSAWNEILPGTKMPCVKAFLNHIYSSRLNFGACLGSLLSRYFACSAEIKFS